MAKWIDKLQARWQVKNAWQVILILVVFACTGFTVMFLKRPILTFLAGEEGNTTTATVLYYIFILPLYNIILLVYGFIFGQFTFFWQFEKRFMERFFSLFRRHK
jgi:hypothetical protein